VTHPSQIKQIKVIVLEPQQLIRESLKALLKESRDTVVVGDAGSSSQLLDVVNAERCGRRPPAPPTPASR
jgi:hypothetical protein